MFEAGADTPRKYLERCLEVISNREAEVKAFVCHDFESAQKAADASSERYRSGRVLSALDGMPFGAKDIFKSAEFPTEVGSEFFRGHRDWQDSAHIYALKRSGAILVGKTTLPELGSGYPPLTRNPYDLSRSPGGSSSGSAALVGAGMLPVATGSQGRGSIIRPASFCGNWALKPTFGALHSGGLIWRSPSYSVMGIHSASLDDCWAVARCIADTVGGDPGHPGLYGANQLGPGSKPSRIALLETAGWKGADEAYKVKILKFGEKLSANGVELISRNDSRDIEKLEKALSLFPNYRPVIAAWEVKYPALMARDVGSSFITNELLARFGEGEKITLEDYRTALISLEDLKAKFQATAKSVDGYLTLSAPSLPPLGMGTGDSIFGDPSSALGAPAWNLPLLEDRELPMGLQLLGQQHSDFKLGQYAK
ncbi:MAG: amidase, partial [Rhodospirillaceae bacterium]